jgi:hypothetical protein
MLAHFKRVGSAFRDWTAFGFSDWTATTNLHNKDADTRTPFQTLAWRKSGVY